MNDEQIVGILFKNKHARYSNTVTPKKYYAADTSTTTWDALCQQLSTSQHASIYAF